VRGFSVAHQIGAAAWPVALVLMASGAAADSGNCVEHCTGRRARF
jgi:hypothetical protein